MDKPEKYNEDYLQRCIDSARTNIKEVEQHLIETREDYTMQTVIKDIHIAEAKRLIEEYLGCSIKHFITIHGLDDTLFNFAKENALICCNEIITVIQCQRIKDIKDWMNFYELVKQAIKYYE